jgi:hypothetical protein
LQETVEKFRIDAVFNRGPNKGKDFTTCIVSDDITDAYSIFTLEYPLAEVNKINGIKLIGLCHLTDTPILETDNYTNDNGRLYFKFD